jgi:hypothetical protein
MGSKAMSAVADEFSRVLDEITDTPRLSPKEQAWLFDRISKGVVDGLATGEDVTLSPVVLGCRLKKFSLAEIAGIS